MTDVTFTFQRKRRRGGKRWITIGPKHVPFTQLRSVTTQLTIFRELFWHSRVRVVME